MDCATTSSYFYVPLFSLSSFLFLFLALCDQRPSSRCRNSFLGPVKIVSCLPLYFYQRKRKKERKQHLTVSRTCLHCHILRDRTRCPPLFKSVCCSRTLSHELLDPRRFPRAACHLFLAGTAPPHTYNRSCTVTSSCNSDAIRVFRPLLMADPMFPMGSLPYGEAMVITSSLDFYSILVHILGKTKNANSSSSPCQLEQRVTNMQKHTVHPHANRILPRSIPKADTESVKRVLLRRTSLNEQEELMALASSRLKDRQFKTFFLTSPRVYFFKAIVPSF